jgi:hypothetical protein
MKSTAFVLGAFLSSSAKADAFSTMGDSTKFTLGCMAGGIPEITTYWDNACVESVGTIAKAMFDAAVVYDEIETVDASAIDFALNVVIMMDELVVVEAECGDGTFIQSLLEAIGIVTVSIGKNKQF